MTCNKCKCTTYTYNPLIGPAEEICDCCEGEGECPNGVVVTTPWIPVKMPKGGLVYGIDWSVDPVRLTGHRYGKITIDRATMDAARVDPGKLWASVKAARIREMLREMLGEVASPLIWVPHPPTSPRSDSSGEGQ
jgi:hypothetical protein